MFCQFRQQAGQPASWPASKPAGQPAGRPACRPDGLQLAGQQGGRLAGQPAGKLAGRPTGWLASRPAGWLASRLAGWPANMTVLYSAISKGPCRSSGTIDISNLEYTDRRKPNPFHPCLMQRDDLQRPLGISPLFHFVFPSQTCEHFANREAYLVRFHDLHSDWTAH